MNCNQFNERAKGEKNMKCKLCGEQFEPMGASYGGVEITQEYCGSECADRAYRAYKRQVRIDEYHERRLTCVQDGLLPPSFLDHATPKPQQSYGLKKAIASKASVWISGQTGRGKSYLARLVLQYHMFEGRRCAFETASNLFNNAKRHEHLQYTPVLCIDDIDKAAYGAYSASLLHDCLTLRENNRLRTIVTCEYDVKHFAARLSESSSGAFGQSTLSRLDALGKRLDIVVEGDNLRLST